MWESSPPIGFCKKQALQIMKSDRFYEGMILVTDLWDNSCLNSLTDQNINKVAWLGQASMALICGCPQHITRKLWSYLSPLERKKANAHAKRAISAWYKRNGYSCEKLYTDMDGSLLQ
jgi:hypothetical protein